MDYDRFLGLAVAISSASRASGAGMAGRAYHGCGRLGGAGGLAPSGPGSGGDTQPSDDLTAAPQPSRAAPAAWPDPEPDQTTRQITSAVVSVINSTIAGEDVGQSVAHLAEGWASDLSMKEQNRLFLAMMNILQPERLLGLHSLSYSFSPKPWDAPEMTALAIRPLGDRRSQTRASFAQFSLNRQEDTGLTLNAGLAHRRILPGGVWMAGMNVFYDHALRYDHRRISVGLDAMTDSFSFAANRYIPLTGWRPSRPGYEQRALAGYDVDLSGSLPGLPSLRLTGKAWRWQTEDSGDQRGDEFGIEFRPTGALTLRLGSRSHADAARQTVASLQLTYVLGASPRRQLTQPPVAAVPLSERLYEQVRRDNGIRVEERLIDIIAPSGHTVAFAAAALDDGNIGDVVVLLSGAEVGVTYALELRNPAQPNDLVRVTGLVTAAQMQLDGLDLSVLADGQIEARLRLTDRAGNTGPDALAVVEKQTTAPAGSTMAAAAEAVNLASQTAFWFELDTGGSWQTFRYEIRGGGDPAQSVRGEGRVVDGVLTSDDIDLSQFADGILVFEIALSDPAAAANASLTFELLKDVVVPTITTVDVADDDQGTGT